MPSNRPVAKVTLHRSSRPRIPANGTDIVYDLKERLCVSAAALRPPGGGLLQGGDGGKSQISVKYQRCSTQRVSPSGRDTSPFRLVSVGMRLSPVMAESRRHRWLYLNAPLSTLISRMFYFLAYDSPTPTPFSSSSFQRALWSRLHVRDQRQAHIPMASSALHPGCRCQRRRVGGRSRPPGEKAPGQHCQGGRETLLFSSEHSDMSPVDGPRVRQSALQPCSCPGISAMVGGPRADC